MQSTEASPAASLVQQHVSQSSAEPTASNMPSVVVPSTTVDLVEQSAMLSDVVQSATSGNVHPMITRSKDGTRKPKVLLTTRHPVPIALSAIQSISEPTCFNTAVKSLEWRATMASEFDALQYNSTWSLVPVRPYMNIVGCKWVYKLKHNADGSVAQLKA